MPATEENPELRRKVCAELWTSFVALIRSYIAAHDLAKPIASHAFVEVGAGRLTVKDEGKTLALEFHAAKGAGSWAVYEDSSGPQHAERGTFEIGEDSQVALSDRAGKLELEVAAEAFTAKIFD